jgi:hypothetical protein
MIREKEEALFQPVANAYLLCGGCQSIRFDDGWRDMNVTIAKEIRATKPIYLVTDGGRLSVECIGVVAFDGAVSPFIHLADELRGLPMWLGRNNTAAHIEYVLVYVSGETPEIISEHVDKVTQVAISHGGMIADILQGLVVVSFMRLVDSLPIQGKRAALVDHLSRDMRRQIKLIHGRIEQHDGKFEVMLGRLSRFEFGQIEEFET